MKFAAAQIVDNIADAMPTNYRDAQAYFKDAKTALCTQLCSRFQDHLNQEIRKKLAENNTRQCEGKKKFIKWLNAELAVLDLGIQHPETGCVGQIFAFGTPGEEGKFVFETKGSKKRSLTTENFEDYLPLILLPDLERLEGFRQQRNRDR